MKITDNVINIGCYAPHGTFHILDVSMPWAILECLLSYTWTFNLGGPAQNPTLAWSFLSANDTPKILQDSLYHVFSSLCIPIALQPQLLFHPVSLSPEGLACTPLNPHTTMNLARSQ